MRKLVLSILAFSLIVGTASVSFARFEPTFESWTNISREVGKESNPVRILKLVRFGLSGASTASVSSGDAVVYDFSANSDDGVTIALTTTSADTAFAGIAVTTIATADATSTSASDDIGRRNWGWIIVHGPANANVGAGGTNNNSAGDQFITSSDSGKITTPQAAGAGNAADINRAMKYGQASGGVFMDAASASATTVKVMVKKNV